MIGHSKIEHVESRMTLSARMMMMACEKQLLDLSLFDSFNGRK
jgi:hypothetical protein